MTSPHDPARRAVIGALASLPLTGCAAESTSANVEVQQPGSRTLVAYFSRSGNTRVVAGLIQRGLGADLFEIRPASAYPEDYLETVEQARVERDEGIEPVLENRIQAMADYGTVYLGFPIWGETAPPVIRSFLRAHEVGRRELVPFITHGGYGLGSNLSVLATHAPNAQLKNPFSIEADQERQTMNRVKGWLDSI